MASVLIIDDETQIRLMLREILEDEGHEVVDAATGEEGIKLYKNKKVQIVITDIIMPDKDGLQTIRELRKINRDVKIVAMSGGGRIVPQDYLPVANAMGAQHILHKPVAYHKLMDVINKLA